MIDITTNKLYIRDKQDEFQCLPGLRGEPGPSTVSCYDFSDYENDLPAGTFNQVKADFDAGKIVFIKWPIPSAGGYTPQLPEDSWIKLAYHNYSDSFNKYFYSENFLVPNANGELNQYYFCLDNDDFIDWYPADYNAAILTENDGVKKDWDTSYNGKILGISSGVVTAIDPPATGVTDVKVNNASVVTSGVANIPTSTSGSLGLVKAGLGATTNASGQLQGISYSGTTIFDTPSSYGSYIVSVGSLANDIASAITSDNNSKQYRIASTKAVADYTIPGQVIDLTGLTAWGPIPSSIGVTLAGIKTKVDTGIPTYIKLDLSNKSIGSWIHIDVVYLKIVAAASNGFVTEPLITEPSYSSAQNDSCFIRFIGYVSGGVETITPQSMFTVPYTTTCPSSFVPSVVLNAAQVSDGFLPKTFNTSYSGKILGIGSNGKVTPVDPPANASYYDFGDVDEYIPSGSIDKIKADITAGKAVYVKWDPSANDSSLGDFPTDSWLQIVNTDDSDPDYIEFRTAEITYRFNRSGTNYDAITVYFELYYDDTIYARRRGGKIPGLYDGGTTLLTSRTGVATNQGVASAGKILGINSSGMVEAIDAPTGGGSLPIAEEALF